MKRTQKDEDAYNAGLRREAPIKTEVIIELRSQLKEALQNQECLLQALVVQDEALRAYRIAALNRTGYQLANLGHCASGCTKHVWNTTDGWHRTNEEK